MDADWHEANDRQVFETGKAMEFEEYSQLKNRSITWLTMKFPLRDAQGKIYAVAGISADISERKRAEQALQESQARLKILNENLENMVVQRTQQVRNLSKALTIAEQRERQRFSVVLHENLQQTLFSAKMLIDTVDCASVEDAQETVEDIHQVRQSIGKAIATTKALAVELNPPILKYEGLDAALKWLARHMQERYGLVICIDISKELSIVKGVDQILIVQLVRELLYNIVKHAQTTDVVISGIRSGDNISVSIEDKGIGFDVAAWRNRVSGSEKMGLFSIEERLRLFGGRLDVQSHAGAGTRVTMDIPLTILESVPS